MPEIITGFHPLHCLEPWSPYPFPLRQRGVFWHHTPRSSEGRAAVQLVGQNIRCLLCFGVLASFRSLDPPIRQNSPSLRKWHQRRQICPQTSLSRSSSSTSRVGANSRSRPQPQERCGMSDQKRAMSGVRSRSASAPLQGS